MRTLTPPQTDDTRDVIVSPNGDLQLFNGTFSPLLSTYHAATGTWTSRTATNWSTANNVTYGGVAAFGNFVFVTDMQTAGETGPNNGIIRFNLADDTWERFRGRHGLHRNDPRPRR